MISEKAEKLLSEIKKTVRDNCGFGDEFFSTEFQIRMFYLESHIDSLELRESNNKKRIAELEAAQRWRVVADGELPEKYRDETREYIPFLVCEGDRDYPFRAMYDGINWGDGMFMLDVTHWMPLPKLPEVQE